MTAVAGAPIDERTAPLSALAPRAGGLEVSTVAADDLRAAIRVQGALTPRTCPLLLGIVSTHLRAGRRHVRLDLTHATHVDPSVVPHLLAAHASVRERGGLLLLDHVDAPIAAAMRAAGLMVVPAA